MGLHTTHECWSGAYSGFAEFREKVGLAARLPYKIDPKPVGSRSLTLDIDWDSVTMRQIQGHWDRKGPTVKASGVYDPPITDPVLYLLVHSDCDGKLRRGYLPELKARLEELRAPYAAIIGGDPYLAGRLEKFISGLEAAIEAGEHVEFC